MPGVRPPFRCPPRFCATTSIAILPGTASTLWISTFAACVCRNSFVLAFAAINSSGSASAPRSLRWSFNNDAIRKFAPTNTCRRAPSRIGPYSAVIGVGSFTSGMWYCWHVCLPSKLLCFHSRYGICSGNRGSFAPPATIGSVYSVWQLAHSAASRMWSLRLSQMHPHFQPLPHSAPAKNEVLVIPRIHRRPR